MIFTVLTTDRYEVDYELILQDFAEDLKADGFRGEDEPGDRRDVVLLAWASAPIPPYFRRIDHEEEGSSLE